MNYWNDEKVNWKCKGILTYILRLHEAYETAEIQALTLQDELKAVAPDRSTAIYSAYEDLQGRGYLRLIEKRNEDMQFIDYFYSGSPERIPEWALEYNLKELEKSRRQSSFNELPNEYFSLLELYFENYHKEVYPEVQSRAEEVDKLIQEYLKEKFTNKSGALEPIFNWNLVDQSKINDNNFPELLKYKDYIEYLPTTEEFVLEKENWTAEQTVINI